MNNLKKFAYRTGFVGTFNSDRIVRGSSANLVDSCEDKRGVLTPKMAIKSTLLYKRQLTFMEQGSVQALLPDPYESKMVKIGKSTRKNAGEGLFTNCFTESNTVVSFYFGERVRLEDFDFDSWDGNCYKIFDPKDYPRGTIDIPQWAQVIASIVFYAA